MVQPVRVWAPYADQVELRVGVTDPTAYPMVAETDGWWRAEQRLGPGERYAFAIDGGPSRPDPRSLSQPDGVHAASEVVDLGAHPWSDAGWRGIPLRDAVLYELHVGTFTDAGTFAGAARRLQHLVDLGVTMVQLMPVAAFPGRHGWGYDGVNLYAVHAPYGGPAGLQAFVDACHGHGLAVSLDVVYNHLGPSGNYLSEFGPYFTDRHGTPWGDAVNLDGPGSDPVRAFLLDNARMWLTDFHLDALRLDAVHALHDERALPLLEELAALADEVTERTGVPRALIAESDRNDPATCSPRGPGGAGGLGLHAQWADDVHHALHVALTGETAGYYADFAAPGALVKVLEQTPFFHDGTLSSFRGRVHGRRLDPSVTPGWRYVASLQTHDQVGNRAFGDRLCHLVPPGQAAAGAALLLTSPYTPMLFMGEEWAAGTPWQYFTDHAEPELAESIRVGRSAEFAGHGWSGEVPDPQDEGTVAASRLDWSELEAPEGEASEAEESAHPAMLRWYQTLLRLRRELPGLRDAELGQGRVEHDLAADTVVVVRGEVTAVANLSAQPRTVSLPPSDADGHHTLAAWGEVSVSDGTAQLAAHSVALLGRPTADAT